jgi:hypothetical protein
MADTLEILAHKIRAQSEVTISHIIETGRLLAEAKALCAHGSWAAWLATEFKWTRQRTAQRLIQVFEMLGSSKYVTVSDLETLDIGIVYAIAAAPREVQAGLLERAAHGEVVTLPVVREARSEHFNTIMDRVFAGQNERFDAVFAGQRARAAAAALPDHEPPVVPEPLRVVGPPPAPAPLRLVDDQSIEWLEKHELVNALRTARDDDFIDFLDDARRRLADEGTFFTWLAKHKIELAEDITLQERARVARQRARRNAPKKIRHAGG